MAAADPDLALNVAKAIADLYADATNSILRRVARRLANGLDDPGWAERKLLELARLRADAEDVVRRLQGEMPETVRRAILDAFASGVTEGAAELSITARPAVEVATEAVEALARQTVYDLARADVQILRSSEDIYRRSVQAGRVVTGVDTRRQATQTMLDRLARGGVKGFVDRQGRQWAATSYAEMATRTAATRAQVQGSLDVYREEGRNFVIVSDSPQECSKCRPFEGRGLSMDGTGVGERYGGIRIIDTVRGAQSAGLWHPNCRHRASPITPGLTRPMRHTADPDGDRARQELRRLERGIREWKAVEAVALDDAARLKAQRKVREWQGRLRDHVGETGLLRQRHREQIGRAI